MRFFKYIIQGVFITIVLLCVAVFFAPSLPVIGHLEVKIVKSGSMEPNIMTGGIVVIREMANYYEGEVITFISQGSTIPTTHRVIGTEEVNGRWLFVTKGDANEERDTALVPLENILGKVLIDVPYLGFVLDFARQPLGFALIIGLPALLIVFDEMEKIWLEIRNRRKVVAQGRDDEDDDESEPDDGGLIGRAMTLNNAVPMMDIATPVQYKVPPTLDLRNKLPIHQTSPAFFSGYKDNLSQWSTICLVLIGSSLFVGASTIPYTVSYFNDVEQSINNTLKSVALDFSVSSELNVFNFLGTKLDTVDSSVLNVVEPENGSADARYDVEVEYTGGSPVFCSAIMANMSVLPNTYFGPLLSLAEKDVDFNGPWSLTLTLDELVDGYQISDYCQVDIVYTAWHQDEANHVGYHDEERVPLIFNAPLLGSIPFERTAPSTELFLLSIENTVSEDEVNEGSDTVIDEIVDEQPISAEETIEDVDLSELTEEDEKEEKEDGDESFEEDVEDVEETIESKEDEVIKEESEKEKEVESEDEAGAGAGAEAEVEVEAEAELEEQVSVTVTP